MTAIDVVAKWRALASEAAQRFEARWTQRRLAQFAGDIAARLNAQNALFYEACLSGTRADVARHGAGVVKGYAAATEAMANIPIGDDAYRIGYDPQTDTHVAVGVGKAPALRVAEINPRMIYLTYDEVAALLGRVAALKPIAAAKRQWPGCEIIGEQPVNQFDQPIPADEATEQDA